MPHHSHTGALSRRLESLLNYRSERQKRCCIADVAPVLPASHPTYLGNRYVTHAPFAESDRRYTLTILFNISVMVADLHVCNNHAPWSVPRPRFVAQSLRCVGVQPVNLLYIISLWGRLLPLLLLLSYYFRHQRIFLQNAVSSAGSSWFFQRRTLLGKKNLAVAIPKKGLLVWDFYRLNPFRSPNHQCHCQCTDGMRSLPLKG